VITASAVASGFLIIKKDNNKSTKAQILLIFAPPI
jgi:hypothetical protein